MNDYSIDNAFTILLTAEGEIRKAMQEFYSSMLTKLSAEVGWEMPVVMDDESLNKLYGCLDTLATEMDRQFWWEILPMPASAEVVQRAIEAALG